VIGFEIYGKNLNRKVTEFMEKNDFKCPSCGKELTLRKT
jgi:predicted RNA-binding Zn-ribbon protein involved in translation (DUF1610 family)